MKNYFSQLRTESEKIPYLQSLPQIILSTFMLTLLMLVLVVFLFNRFPKEKESYHSIPESSTRPNRKCLLLTENFVGVHALQTYEHNIIGSQFPIYLYCDHKRILDFRGRKGQLSHSFSRYHVIISKFQNLKTIWTPGSNLAFPETLNRNVTINEYQKH